MDPQKVECIRADIRASLFNRKVIAFPIATRLAWHASGTFERSSMTGGSDGATMRFEPEAADPANAGLSIPRDLLQNVHQKYPDVSLADIYTLAGALAVEFAGGPRIPFQFGRKDDRNGRRCPAHGRLPDASQGSDHLRDVFYRMGFDDREIVALSGGHTLGRCHFSRSGFDGKWTHAPLVFDNSYFKNLITLTWEERKWDGNRQFTDAESGELMMLPTDIALKTDPAFRPWVELYARDEAAFFRDFADAFGKLLALGTPPQCCPFAAKAKAHASRSAPSAIFREACMHGHSVPELRDLASKCDPHELEPHSRRSALHKAAFWGHDHAIKLLVGPELGLRVDVQDSDGDTALHDACKFGHPGCVRAMLAANGAAAAMRARNKQGKTPADLASEYGKTEVVQILRGARM